MRSPRHPLLGPLLASLAFAAGMTLSPAARGDAEPFLVALDESAAPVGNVLEMAAAAGQFEIFLALIEAAGMQETLQGEGPITLIAPTDAALENFEQARLDWLLSPRGHDEAMALVAHHVVAEEIDAEAMPPGVRRIEAANGHMLTLDTRDGVRVDGELVVVRDMRAANGAILGINQVLSPPVRVAAR